MTFSHMQSSALLNKTLPILKPPVMLRDPVRVLRSSPVGGLLTDTGLMIRRNTNQPVQGIKNNREGGNLVAPEAGAVVEVAARTLVFPNHVGTSNLNDNYRKVCPTLVHLNIRLDEKVYPSQTVNSSLLDSSIIQRDSQFKVHQDVLCPVVDHVHAVQCIGHPQKKGLSPSVLKNKIKESKVFLV